ncbi:TIGR02391 family protein [Micrococcus luteus]|uniref:TIGR02391 family protein n=1 Tax=Micrococcus TaxID=1269 RepID=UPI0020055F0C|nr:MULTISPECIES: TIGR02391 family protein [Micrococcus]MCK6214874.1 TIGR02391 family protein [Micrococcus luteus]MCV7518104.1 TIGR02391 family protein [Micrococcus luteus]MCV7730843.1 TIGR02391 family protein [Micrococcus luteus]WAC16290.1 TIGR02391 family protein [Micrococcus sp. SL257]
MSGLNTEWAIEQFDKFIDQTVMRNGSVDGFITTADYTAAPEAEVAKQAQIVEKILVRVTPNWRDELTGKMANNRWAKHREAVIRAREELIRADEIRQNLGDDAPEISASNLHPWIWSGARSLWQSGHFVQAVRDAATKLNAETQNKVGRRDVSETDLFKQSFSLDEAKPGMARLRRLTPEDSDTYRSVQRGAMAFAEGVFAGIRNPLSHEVDQEMSEQVALEHLAALSVLARWVDESTVEHAGESS